MTLQDVLCEPGFPHGTPAGYTGGCQGSHCPGTSTLSCRDAMRLVNRFEPAAAAWEPYRGRRLDARELAEVQAALARIADDDRLPIEMKRGPRPLDVEPLDDVYDDLGVDDDLEDDSAGLRSRLLDACDETGLTPRQFARRHGMAPEVLARFAAGTTQHLHTTTAATLAAALAADAPDPPTSSAQAVITPAWVHTLQDDLANAERAARESLAELRRLRDERASEPPSVAAEVFAAAQALDARLEAVEAEHGLRVSIHRVAGERLHVEFTAVRGTA